MEFAIGLMGVGLTTLGIILGYMWKSNGHMQREMMTILRHISEEQKDIV